MSTPTRETTLNTIHDSIRIGFAQIERRLDRLEADTSLIRENHQTAATKLALIEQECNRRGKRCSELVRRVMNVENTDAIQITKDKVTWRTLVIVATAAVGLLGVLFSAVQILK